MFCKLFSIVPLEKFLYYRCKICFFLNVNFKSLPFFESRRDTIEKCRNFGIFCRSSRLEVFLRISRIDWKTSVQESPFRKTASLPAILLKNDFSTGVLSMTFVKFLRTPFLKDTSKPLLQPKNANIPALFSRDYSFHFWFVCDNHINTRWVVCIFIAFGGFLNKLLQLIYLAISRSAESVCEFKSSNFVGET